MSFTDITITATRTSRTKRIAFDLRQTMVNGVDVVAPGPTVGLIVGGQLLDSDCSSPFVLPANNDPDTTPTGASYFVTESGDGPDITYAIVLPYDAAFGTIDLSELMDF